MPDSILAPSPTVVLPQLIMSAFSRSRAILVDENRYRDGSLQNRQLASTSRSTWTITRRLTAAQFTELEAFYNDRVGGWLEFYFYDPYETSPLFSYDATGATSTGRHIGIFVGNLNESLLLGRNAAQFGIIEIG